MSKKKRAPRNRTLTLSDEDKVRLRKKLLLLREPVSLDEVRDRTIHQDCHAALPLLPQRTVDLLFADPPYNIDKDFNGRRFSSRALDKYEEWLSAWLEKALLLLKETATVYICGDWRSSTAIHRVLERHDLHIQNRITWKREKGRGAKTNWKNASEDIWFATLSSSNYTFNVDDVKLKRRVLAPYTDKSGKPKDWSEENGGRFRLTHPSNVWTDLTVPFWSMPENTDHPTQKPEKLLAKVILASSNPGDMVLDPFLGSGTTSVVAKKLGRHFIGIERDDLYGCFSERRLELAEEEPRIQGYTAGVFWERNTKAAQERGRNESDSEPTGSRETKPQQALF